MFTSLLLLAGLAAALPQPIETTTGSNTTLLTRDGWGGIYMCDGADWKGSCKNIVQFGPSDNCYTIPRSSSAVSWGPAPGVHCYLYKTGGCVGDSLYVTYPGTSDLGRLSDYGHNVRGYICRSVPFPKDGVPRGQAGSTGNAFCYVDDATVEASGCVHSNPGHCSDGTKTCAVPYLER